MLGIDIVGQRASFYAEPVYKSDTQMLILVHASIYACKYIRIENTHSRRREPCPPFPVLSLALWPILRCSKPE